VVSFDLKELEAKGGVLDNLYSLKAWVTCTSHMHEDALLKTRQIKVKKHQSTTLDYQSINPFHQ